VVARGRERLEPLGHLVDDLVDALHSPCDAVVRARHVVRKRESGQERAPADERGIVGNGRGRANERKENERKENERKDRMPHA
jgi:hypothetical protein